MEPGLGAQLEQAALGNRKFSESDLVNYKLAVDAYERDVKRRIAKRGGGMKER